MRWIGGSTMSNTTARPARYFARALAIAALVAATAALSAHARDAGLYRAVPASPDGIGKQYQGREIAQVMGYDGAPWLDRPTRDREERTDWLVDSLPLDPAMTVADIGAGSGYLTRRLAARVPRGRVYAVDVQPEMVALLERLARYPGLSNVTPVLGREDAVPLPAASVDLAILVDVYHELAYPAEMVDSIVAALKPGGRLVLVEYRGEDPAVPIKALHKMT